MTEWWQFPRTADQRAVEQDEVGRIVVGAAEVWLGGGRAVPGQPVDPRVGLSQVLPLGAIVLAGQPLAGRRQVLLGVKSAENFKKQVGDTFRMGGAGYIHSVAWGEGEPAVSIHAYSPPLWRLGQYSITEDGILQRTTVSYADELRPM